MNFNGMYFGTITEVLSPENAKNKSKYQYEYIVAMVGDLYATISVRCIVMDRVATKYNSEEVVLDTKTRVCIQFPRGDSSLGIITGCIRSRPDKVKTTKRPVYRNRINETEMEVSNEGGWAVRLRDQPDGVIGPELEFTKELITLYGDKEAADNGIIIDRKAKKITIKTGEWAVTTEKDATLTIAGDANIKVKGKANIEAGDTKVKTKKLDATVDGNAKVTVSGKLTAKAQFIELNGDVGGVLTTATQPTCYVTGAPFIGSLTVKAGN